MQISGNTSLTAARTLQAYSSRANRTEDASTATGAAPAAATSKTYDFSNMSPNEMVSAMNDLISSGKMTFDESTSLVGMIPTALQKVQYDGTAPAAYWQKTDFLSKLKIGIEGAKSRNDDAGAKSLQSALDALTRSQGTPSSVSPIHETA